MPTSTRSRHRVAYLDHLARVPDEAAPGRRFAADLSALALLGRARPALGTTRVHDARVRYRAFSGIDDVMRDTEVLVAESLEHRSEPRLSGEHGPLAIAPPFPRIPVVEAFRDSQMFATTTCSRWPNESRDVFPPARGQGRTSALSRANAGISGRLFRSHRRRSRYVYVLLDSSYCWSSNIRSGKMAATQQQL